MKAILTGDIIKSTQLNSQRRKELYSSFSDLSNILQKHYSNEIIPFQLSNFRGDSWQLVVEKVEKSPEIAVFVRAFFRYTFSKEKLDTRIAIGIGEVDFIPPENISGGDGRAFFLSGSLLDSLRTKNMGIRVQGYYKKNGFTYDGLQTVIELLDIIISDWNSSQCQVVFWAMQNLNQTEIAKNWQPQPIKQSSVSYNYKKANWKTITESLRFCENAIHYLTE